MNDKDKYVFGMHGGKTLVECPFCPVLGLPGFWMDHHILRCGEKDRYEFGKDIHVINVNFKKAVHFHG